VSSLLKALGKSLVSNLPYVREKYLQREFLRTAPSFRGLYRSFAEAQADSPPGKLAGYNHPAVAEFYRKWVDQLNPGDYPVLFWLARLLPDTKFVFELGGSIGKGYYGYRRYLSFPPQLRWVICETPEMARLGTEIAMERKEGQLTFTDQREPVGEPDLYATFGTLQYLEEPFVEIIGRLRAKPPHLLINRVPLGEGPAFITLQNNGSWFSPYKVENKSDFIRNLRALGYELVDQWEMERPHRFLMNLDQPVPNYHGIYFRLK
jgi:putative methyltransferase (TIGR04325 family)